MLKIYGGGDKDLVLIPFLLEEIYKKVVPHPASEKLGGKCCHVSFFNNQYFIDIMLFIILSINYISANLDLNLIAYFNLIYFVSILE